MAKTLVIAEIGACHDGKLEQAYRLIDAAKHAAADCVKGQFWSSSTRMVERRRAPKYAAIYERYRMPKSWLLKLRDYAQDAGVWWACSVYLPEDVPTVEATANLVKISSFEAGDIALARVVARTVPGSRAVVSLGMGATWPLVDYTPIRLHCVSAYPAPLNALHLEAIRAKGLQGFSDHSGDLRVGGWAVAAGAQIIEVHLRLDDTDPENPDAGPHALCPVTLEAYIREIREVEQAMTAPAVDVEAPMSQYRVA